MKNAVTFKNLSKYPELVSVVSIRQAGDLNARKPLGNSNLENFLSNLKINRNQLVMAEQIHDGQVAIVTQKDAGTIIVGTDGLVTAETNIFLGVNTADCLPILFYDPQNGICALAHAGWKGSLERIAQKTVETMEKMGSSAENTIVGIGPHIKVCCYNIPLARVKLFQDAFGMDREIFRESGHKVYLDLTYLNLKQLKEVGIREENIEVSSYCTYHTGEFFSARCQKKEDFTENLAIIGRRS